MLFLISTSTFIHKIPIVGKVTHQTSYCSMDVSFLSHTMAHVTQNLQEGQSITSTFCATLYFVSRISTEHERKEPNVNSAISNSASYHRGSKQGLVLMWVLCSSYCWFVTSCNWLFPASWAACMLWDTHSIYGMCYVLACIHE